MKLYLRRKFDAAHRLPNHEGKCAMMHGHTWVVEMWCEGEIDESTGMLVDFGEIKEVIDSLDHGVLNDHLPLPTAENLVGYLLYRIPAVVKVRVWESENAYAEDVSRQ